MKTKIFTLAFSAFMFAVPMFAQDRTTVTATGSDISDNLDLKAVASIFGDSQNLEDFEQRLNDPKTQISNLDLNNDNQVDYLRVIESVEGNTHLVIVQAVLEKDVYQDVATIEVEKDNNNQVQVQVVGDVYMYGQNYVYEPVYVTRPIIYNHFWIANYHPYVSAWYWNYYPTYYYAWNPYPIYRYRRNVHTHINIHNHYNYAPTRRSQTAVALYNGRRANGYEVRNPDRSFDRRNANVANRYELDRTRTASIKRQAATDGTRNTAIRTNNGVRTNNPVRSNNTIRTNTDRSATSTKRDNTDANPVRNNGIKTAPTRVQNTQANQTTVRSNNPTIRTESPVRTQTTNPIRVNPTRSSSMPTSTSTAAPRQNTARTASQPAATRAANAESRNAAGRR